MHRSQPRGIRRSRPKPLSHDKREPRMAGGAQSHRRHCASRPEPRHQPPSRAAGSKKYSAARFCHACLLREDQGGDVPLSAGEFEQTFNCYARHALPSHNSRRNPRARLQSQARPPAPAKTRNSWDGAQTRRRRTVTVLRPAGETHATMRSSALHAVRYLYNTAL